MILFLSLLLNFTQIKSTSSESALEAFDIFHLFKRWNIYIVFLVAFIPAAFYSFVGIDYLHDGVMLNLDLDVAYGRVLYRDTFNQYGALPIYLQVIAMLIFGKYLVVIKLMTALFYGLTAVILYLIFKKFLGELMALISCILCFLIAPYWLISPPFYPAPLIPWPSVYALFFQLAALYSMIKYYEIRFNKDKQSKEKLTEFKDYKYLLFSGLFIAFTFLSKQNVGAYELIIMYIILILLSVLCRKKLKIVVSEFVYLTLGFATGMGIFIINLLITHSYKDWYFQNIEFASKWVNSLGKLNYLRSDGGAIVIIYTYLKTGLIKHLHLNSDYIFNIIDSMLIINNPTRVSLIWRILPLICIAVFLNKSIYLLIRRFKD